MLADATLRPDDHEALKAKLPGVEIPALATKPNGEFDGPSYLEALVYTELVGAGVVADDSTPWIKATGGYEVRNLEAILAVAARERSRGLCFLHQSPLRVRRRFAMSAFYLLEGRELNRFLAHVATNVERARREPLEALLLQFFEADPRTGTVRAPYPRVDAFFTTAGLHSSSPRLLPNWLAWRALSAAGLYALSMAPADGPPAPG